jgi:phosphoadenosine phosphosulfate reductase
MFDNTALAPPEIAAAAIELDRRLYDARPAEVIAAALDRYEGSTAAVSSFGTESAVLLHMVAGVDRHTPVLFLDTGMLFEETLAYRDQLADRLGLTDIRVFRPEDAAVAAGDPDSMLWSQDTNACCALRKVVPLERALQGFDAWFNGRKRFHGDSRSALPVVEADGARIKFNPLANIPADELKSYFERHDLPRHPLQSLGFSSIGCMPCTSRTREGEGVRAGRWRGSGKTECGIHITK